MSKKDKTKDWTQPHHDGVSDKCMIARPPRQPMLDDAADETAYLLRSPANAEHLRASLTQEHTLQVTAWVDGEVVGHVLTEDAHYPDDGIPYVYDGRAGIVKALRELADRIESDVPTGEWP